MRISRRTCWCCVVVLAAIHHTDVDRSAVEQMTGRHRRWWKVVEMLTQFIQSASHRTADIPRHSLRRIDSGVRVIRGAQELPVGILGAFCGEHSSWGAFVDDEDCRQKHDSYRAERHRSAIFSTCRVSAGGLWLRIFSETYIPTDSHRTKGCADHAKLGPLSLPNSATYHQNVITWYTTSDG